MTEGDRQRLRATFGEDAELYDRCRPGYPRELFDDLAALANADPGPGSWKSAAAQARPRCRWLASAAQS